MSDPVLGAVVPVSIRLERQLNHDPEKVFDAYANAEERVLWQKAPDEPNSVLAPEFQVGATHSIGRLAGRSTIAYEHIVRSERIALTERLHDFDGRLLAISAITWTISASRAGGTLLAVTNQTTSIAGSGPIEGLQYRYEVMLDRLEQHLANRSRG